MRQAVMPSRWVVWAGCSARRSRRWCQSTACQGDDIRKPTADEPLPSPDEGLWNRIAGWQQGSRHDCSAAHPAPPAHTPPNDDILRNSRPAQAGSRHVPVLSKSCVHVFSRSCMHVLMPRCVRRSCPWQGSSVYLARAHGTGRHSTHACLVPRLGAHLR